jgi:hypothetical protein
MLAISTGCSMPSGTSESPVGGTDISIEVQNVDKENYKHPYEVLKGPCMNDNIVSYLIYNDFETNPVIENEYDGKINLFCRNNENSQYNKCIVYLSDSKEATLNEQCEVDDYQKIVATTTVTENTSGASKRPEVFSNYSFTRGEVINNLDKDEHFVVLDAPCKSGNEEVIYIYDASAPGVNAMGMAFMFPISKYYEGKASPNMQVTYYIVKSKDLKTKRDCHPQEAFSEHIKSAYVMTFDDKGKYEKVTMKQ